VKGLPPTGSWQDIKDHMREAGEVLYAEVYGDGSGIVEFAHSDDVKYAVKNLDDTEFRSHEVCLGYVCDPQHVWLHHILPN
jgi:arginine/serine-rich splicing factor 1/9